LKREDGRREDEARCQSSNDSDTVNFAKVGTYTEKRDQADTDCQDRAASPETTKEMI
jgi:hypothetical protein